jgi:hypothetical protein
MEVVDKEAQLWPRTPVPTHLWDLGDHHEHARRWATHTKKRIKSAFKAKTEHLPLSIRCNTAI